VEKSGLNPEITEGLAALQMSGFPNDKSHQVDFFRIFYSAI
jgi:hypothetical protein